MMVSFAKKVILLLVQDTYSLVFAFPFGIIIYDEIVIIMMIFSNRIFFYILSHNIICIVFMFFLMFY